MFIYILCDLLFLFGVIFFYLTWLFLCFELCKRYYTTQNIQTKLPKYLLFCKIPGFSWMCEASGLMVLRKYYTVDDGCLHMVLTFISDDLIATGQMTDHIYTR